ncbi:hypothetical protein MFKK_27660 [Halopseudomonas aestusnigri]|uniref:multidrug/biocide efflux PACE transporter n=1 Tax=Halopseudomonas TaxID=2901189 RepID=UPI0022B65F20|nr:MULTISPECIES: multidrug/biocide efflux PACE transporter [Halopseudomonas]BDX19956.1 hypothetical protein MFKK_27660 [Halopseudomonas aestusnigri]
MTANVANGGMSLRERMLHAGLFELIAVMVFAPLITWVTGKPLHQAGALTLTLSCIAMLWNMVFTAAFQHIERQRGWRRTLRVRLLHASLFECGLVVVMVPVIALWLQVRLMEALLLDIGLILLFLPYTLVFNWLYDRARARVLSGRLGRLNNP